MVKKIGIVCSAAAMCSGAALASNSLHEMSPTSLYADVGAGSQQATRAGYYEDFERFALSWVNQWGWLGDGPSIIVNSGIAGFGQRSVRVGVYLDQGWGGRAFSPTIPLTYGIVAADFHLVDDPDISTVGFTTINSVSGYVNTRVFFQPGGGIGVLQVDEHEGVILPSTGAWTEGVVTQIGIEVLAGNMLNVYQDGALIFTGHDIVQEAGVGSGGFDRPVGVINYGGPTAIFDNITDVLVPSPGALALFGVAGFAAARRRR